MLRRGGLVDVGCCRHCRLTPTAVWPGRGWSIRRKILGGSEDRVTSGTTRRWWSADKHSPEACSLSSFMSSWRSRSRGSRPERGPRVGAGPTVAGLPVAWRPKLPEHIVVVRRCRRGRRSGSPAAPVLDVDSVRGSVLCRTLGRPHWELGIGQKGVFHQRFGAGEGHSIEDGGASAEATNYPGVLALFSVVARTGW